MTRTPNNAVLATLATALAAGPGAWAQQHNDAAAASRPASAASAAAPAAKRAVLLIVAGNKPVAQAAVQMQVRDGPLISATSNDDGEASLAHAAASVVHVRVIAAGWATFIADLNQAPGQRTEVKLQAVR